MFVEKNITLSHQSQINMLGTFTSCQDGVRGTSLPFHLKQLEDQTKYMEKKIIFRHWTRDSMKLDPGKIETDEISPRRMSRLQHKAMATQRSTQYHWIEGTELKVQGGPRKLEYVGKAPQSWGSCTERMQRGPSNLENYNVTIWACKKWDCPGPGKELIDQTVPWTHTGLGIFCVPTSQNGKMSSYLKYWAKSLEGYHLGGETKLALD